MYYETMSKTLQIRDVPDEVHAGIHARAAEAGQSTSQYLLAVVTELGTRPSLRTVVEEAELDAQAGGGARLEDVDEVIREGRE